MKDGKPMLRAQNSVYFYLFRKSASYRLPNGEPSKLTERQWVQVRTENFKKWFGDWEKIALQKELDEMKALAVTPSEEVLTKRDIESLFEQVGAVKNNRDGRIVTFPKATAGKVFYHKGTPAQLIVPSVKEIFEQSIPIYSEAEKEMPGHKPHRNIKDYHNYVGKVLADGNEYYVRFTVREEAVWKNNKKPKNEAHSFAISAVELYQKNKGSLTEIHTKQTLGKMSPNPIDKRLNEWFESVNENEASKNIDENGESCIDALPENILYQSDLPCMMAIHSLLGCIS